MNRSGYSDDCEGWPLIIWRVEVENAIEGQRGQAFLKELLVALDALPESKLISGKLEAEDGSVCALGAVGRARSIPMAALPSYDRKTMAAAFGIPQALAAEIMYINDESLGIDDKARFAAVRQWVEDQIIKTG